MGLARAEWIPALPRDIPIQTYGVTLTLASQEVPTSSPTSLYPDLAGILHRALPLDDDERMGFVSAQSQLIVALEPGSHSSLRDACGSAPVRTEFMSALTSLVSVLHDHSFPIERCSWNLEGFFPGVGGPAEAEHLFYSPNVHHLFGLSGPQDWTVNELWLRSESEFAEQQLLGLMPVHSDDGFPTLRYSVGEVFLWPESDMDDSARYDFLMQQGQEFGDRAVGLLQRLTELEQE